MRSATFRAPWYIMTELSRIEVADCKIPEEYQSALRAGPHHKSGCRSKLGILMIESP